MRVKQVWNYVPLPAKLKLVWDRLTFSRLTTIYIIFSVLHCLIQAALQISAFIINANAASFLYNIALQGNATTEFAVPAMTDNDIRLCKDVPVDYQDLSQCAVVWDATAQSATPNITSGQAAVNYGQSPPSAVASSASVSSVLSSVIPSASALDLGAPANAVASVFGLTASAASATVASASATPKVVTIVVVNPPVASSKPTNSLANVDVAPDGSLFHKRATQIKVLTEDGTVSVIINGHGYNNVTKELSKSCLWSLNWPVNNLDNTKREDIVFIAFQFWVLGMSFVALLNESMPHMFASLLTHVLATAWSGFQISNTALFKANFKRMITDGACNGVTLLPDYWEDRARLEYPILALNVVSLIISAFLTWRLVKAFGWQTFKRVGASLKINRIYKLVLTLSIVIQLSFFFVGATVGLWLDSLINGIASQVAWFVPLYKATSIITLVLLPAWLWTGWYSIRQEKRVPMFIFLVLSLVYMSGWSVMFLATTFRWLFITWRFFTVISVASILLTALSFILGVVCRYNFGSGLARYLNAQEPLPGEDFAPVNHASDLEKVAFPGDEEPIPTFSVAFGSGSEVPPPSQMFAGRLGPRFYNRSAEPFETPKNSPPESTVSGSDGDAPAPRSPIGSVASYYSYSPTHSSFSHSRSESQGQSINTVTADKRWVIE